ncbi:phosphatase PAP2 family protein [Streptomyces sp. NPDC051567]|uniref:phosphatase PAP2 family protein n=1 Tax=Streptomyces sp. NPDC051567 TaxID=3365660 RepID=UPI0037B7BFE6
MRPVRGFASSLRRTALDLSALDRALYAAVAATPTPTLDTALRRLSGAADHSKISFAVAGLLSLRGGAPRTAALLGVGAIAVASAGANLLGKNLLPRHRPDRDAAQVPWARQVPMPGSTSFPSGHSASAFAFATAVGCELPWTAAPLSLLAATVAYSRVHTGVHYPADVAAGSVLGVAAAAAVIHLARRRAGCGGCGGCGG